MTRTKIAHNGTLYEVTETITVESQSEKFPNFAKLMEKNGIVAIHSVKRTNGRKSWMLDEYANGMTGNLVPLP